MTVAIYASSAVIILVVVLSMMIVFLAQRQRRNAELKLANEEIYHRKRLAHATLEAHEEERQLIGKELHDDLGQHLISIRMFLEESLLNGNKDKLSDAIESLNDSISKCSNISHILYPAVLHRLGLKKALEQIIYTIESNSNITVESTIELPTRLPENYKIHIFRIFQEQTSNSLKHAQCTAITLGVKPEGDHLILSYSDNGKGFESKLIHRGLGLHNIKTRSDAMSADCTITSEDGYRSIIDIPL